MIVTVTINPALDKSTMVPRFVAETKLRCSEMVVEAGGGGINVSKAIRELGGESMAIFPCGGLNGLRLKNILERQNIRFQAVAVGNETREDFTVTEDATNSQYRFVMPGQTLTANEIEACLDNILLFQPAPALIVASGSLPTDAPDDFFARIAAICKGIRAKCIVDTSGEPLLHAAREGVYLLKPNLSELGCLVGKEMLQLSEVEHAARQVILQGHSEIIVVSMGASGALLVTKELCKRIHAPVVKKMSTVGAGDSMVAGMAWMIEQGKSLIETVQFGVACGTAATMNPGTQLFKREDAAKLYNWIQSDSGGQ